MKHREIKDKREKDKPLSPIVTSIESQALGLYDKTLKTAVIDITKMLIDDTDTEPNP